MRLQVTEISKRAFDIVTAILLLAITWPLLVLLGAYIAMDGGPALFAHERIGYKGKAFKCLKFRTMITGASECLDEYLTLHPDQRVEWTNNQKLAFDPRVTRIGRMLRRASLDELPQLVNVIRGEMSLVGPRPVTEQELNERYGQNTAYLRVRPGMTGLWQVSGRNQLSYEERILIDTAYVAGKSVSLDLAILLRTISVVTTRGGQ